MNRNSVLTLLVWIGLALTIYGQFYVIKHMRHSLIAVSGLECGMFRAQMAEHDTLQLCRLALAQAQASTTPVLQSCFCENPGGGFLDRTPPVTPFF